MPKLVDIVGETFGRWQVIRKSKSDKGFGNYWDCLCSCGNVGRINGASLKVGDSKSCGCLKIEKMTKHGDHKSPTYNSWDSMIGRCTRPSQPEYDDYGGRGITVCKEWLESFIHFRNDMGYRPEGMTIERINTNGNYSKDNCKWATNIEQQNNKRYNLKVISHGIEVSIRTYSEQTGISIVNIRNRLIRGVPKDKLHLTPKQYALSLK